MDKPNVELDRAGQDPADGADMRKLLTLLTTLFFCTALAQTVDLEGGVKGFLDGAKTPYADTRFNFQLGPQLLGQDLYLVLEPGIMVMDPPSLWLAGELLVDGEYSTEFLRLEYTEATGLYFKAGFRLGFDFGYAAE